VDFGNYFYFFEANGLGFHEYWKKPSPILVIGLKISSEKEKSQRLFLLNL